MDKDACFRDEIHLSATQELEEIMWSDVGWENAHQFTHPKWTVYDHWMQRCNCAGEAQRLSEEVMDQPASSMGFEYPPSPVRKTWYTYYLRNKPDPTWLPCKNQ